jgi:hypothetical protein
MLAKWPLLAGVLAGSLLASAQISPGRLARAHASLEGATNCTKCHAAAAGQREFRCVDCHTEIAQRVDARAGYHGRVAARERRGTDCAHCHSEHNGEDFRLVHWQPPQQQFDHAQTGYSLEGKHRGLACERCHNASRIPAAARSNIKVSVLDRTFLGLTSTCASCHEDKHRGQLGSHCLQCHNHENWKSVSGFDHGKTRFPLTGAHLRVTCAQCHGPNPRIGDQPLYKGLRFDGCAACHPDPHRGSFAPPCQSCHSTDSWKAARAKYDHSKTAFPLTGKHGEVACAACHKGADFSRPLAHARCRDCHSDTHQGQFARRSGGGECAECHTTAGFTPSTFTVAQHSLTAFPLRARHVSVACAKCHTGTGPQMRFKLAFARCADCHKDPHAGQFAAAPHSNRCEGCHSEDRFTPSTFTPARHNQGRFQLRGAHAAVPCSDCHRAGADGGIRYRFADQRCEACHRDPHGGQFAARMAASSVSCALCHTVENWRDVTAFDHAQTRFPLLGAHRAVDCADCHKAADPAQPLREATFAGTPTRCSACHDDVHGGQFGREGRSGECSQCHETRVWTPAKFDHDTRTSFPLKGGHEGVACARCHTQRQALGGKSVVIYHLAPRQCVACHNVITQPR